MMVLPTLTSAHSISGDCTPYLNFSPSPISAFARASEANRRDRKEPGLLTNIPLNDWVE